MLELRGVAWAQRLLSDAQARSRSITSRLRSRSSRRAVHEEARGGPHRRKHSAIVLDSRREIADGAPCALRKRVVALGEASRCCRWNVARLGRRSTIVGVPPSAVPNFAKSLIVVARRGFSDAARRSIVSLSERSFFARAPLGCDVSRGRERDVRDESASVCLGGAGRQWYRGRPFGDRRSARGTKSLIVVAPRGFSDAATSGCVL